MPRLSNKHENMKIIDLGQFDGGLRHSISNEAIEDNEMTGCVNFEYDNNTRSLKVVDGFRTLFDAGQQIRTCYFDTTHMMFLYQGEDNHLYYTSLGAKTDLGLLSGKDEATYAQFKTGVLVASGGKLQQFDGYTMKTLETPDAEIVFVRDGRIGICHSKSDTLKYSGIMEEVNWKDSGKPADAFFLPINAADGAGIKAVVPLASDLVIYKTNGRVFRLSGNSPDNWEVHQVVDAVTVLNRHCVASVLNDVYFISHEGFNSMSTVVEYGAMKVAALGQKVNSSLVVGLSSFEAKMWYVPSRGQVWVKPRNNGNVYMYHLHNKAFTVRMFERFEDSNLVDLKDVINYDGNTYVVLGGKIAILDGEIATCDGREIQSFLRSKFFVSNYDFLIKRVDISLFCLNSGDGFCEIGDLKIPLKFMNGGMYIWDDDDHKPDTDDPNIYDISIDMNSDGILEGDYGFIWEMPTVNLRVRCNYRIRGTDLALSIARGSFSLRSIRIFYTEV